MYIILKSPVEIGLRDDIFIGPVLELLTLGASLVNTPSIEQKCWDSLAIKNAHESEEIYCRWVTLTNVV